MWKIEPNTVQTRDQEVVWARVAPRLSACPSTPLPKKFGAHNLIVDPRDQGAAPEWSPTHIPDLTALNKAEGGFHLCADTKVANYFASQYAGTLEAMVQRAAPLPFSASGEYSTELLRPSRAL